MRPAARRGAAAGIAALLMWLSPEVPPLIAPVLTQMAAHKGITEVAGIRVGHYTLQERPTGCTVVLADGEGAVGGVSQRGGAPGTRETDLLGPSQLVERVNAVVLAGGSAFGLAAAEGVVRYLEERKIGYRTGAGVVPIVPAAISTISARRAMRGSGRRPTAATARHRPPRLAPFRRATSARARAPPSASSAAAAAEGAARR